MPPASRVEHGREPLRPAGVADDDALLVAGDDLGDRGRPGAAPAVGDADRGSTRVLREGGDIGSSSTAPQPSSSLQGLQPARGCLFGASGSAGNWRSSVAAIIAFHGRRQVRIVLDGRRPLRRTPRYLHQLGRSLLGKLRQVAQFPRPASPVRISEEVEHRFRPKWNAGSRVVNARRCLTAVLPCSSFKFTRSSLWLRCGAGSARGWLTRMWGVFGGDPVATGIERPAVSRSPFRLRIPHKEE